MKSDTIFALGTLLLGVAEAATCDLTNNFAEPVLANGWEHKLIVKGLTKPRSILFDSEGNGPRGKTGRLGPHPIITVQAADWLEEEVALFRYGR